MGIKNIKDKVDDLLLPKLDMISIKVNKVIDQMEGKASDAFQNDETMKNVLRRVHESLPFFIRMSVNGDRFVQFCMKHREKFIKREEKNDQSENDNDDSK